MRILLADDQDEDVFLLVEAFRLVGETPTITRLKDGQEVLRMMEPPASIPFDILVIDYVLPLKDGASVIEQLSVWKILPALPCVLVSSHLHLHSSIANRLSELGVRLIAEKPADLDKLCDLARSIAALAKQSER